MTELQAVPGCLVGEEHPELPGRTATPAYRAVMARMDCRGREVCQGRMDWTESRDLLGLRACRDLRAHLGLRGRGEGSETRERPDLRDLSALLDPPAPTAATDLLAQPDLQVSMGPQVPRDRWDQQGLKDCRERLEHREREDCRDLRVE